MATKKVGKKSWAGAKVRSTRNEQPQASEAESELPLARVAISDPVPRVTIAQKPLTIRHKAVHVDGLPEFVQEVEQRCLERDEVCLFRGQSEDWPLKPKLARISAAYQSLAVTEQKMLDELKRASVPYLGSYRPESEWEWLTIAQHHGLPTRLLDWTDNPLAALWFAVKDPPSLTDAGRKKAGIVWMLKPDVRYRLSAALGHPQRLVDVAKRDRFPWSMNFSGFFRPSDSIRRVSAQRAWFTVHPEYQGHGFVELQRSVFHARKLTKFVIRGARFSDLRFQLDRVGVNRANLFPDLDGLCSHIEWLNTQLTDEPPSWKGEAE